MPGQRRSTMPDVARLAGVSIKTVSRVVNGEPNVSAKTNEAVLKAIEELKFRRNDLARNLRAGTSSRTIGLVIEDLSNPFYGAVARGVEEVAQEHGAMVITASSEEHAEREAELVAALVQRRVDGLLMVPASDDHRYLQPELAMGTPIVFLDRPPAKLKTDQVIFDNEGGAKRGVAQLLAQGHRRIAALSPGKSIYTTTQRMQGFRAAMAEAGATVDEALVAEDCQDPDGAERAAAAMLAMRRPPAAFFAANNRMTLGLIRALRQAQVRKPIVAFDDFELADVVPLPLTIIAGEPSEMGKRGAELLFERLESEGAVRPRRIVLQTDVLARGTAS